MSIRRVAAASLAVLVLSAPASWSSCIDRTPEWAFQNAEVVLIGRVSGIRSLVPDKLPKRSSDPNEITFRQITVFKGTPRDSLTIRGDEFLSFCGGANLYEFKLGVQYYLYLRADGIRDPRTFAETKVRPESFTIRRAILRVVGEREAEFGEESKHLRNILKSAGK